MPDSLGLYISIPFCRAKCTFCNFASDSFAPGRLPAYLDALSREIAGATARAAALGAPLPETVDTVYLGGGTPSLLSANQARDLFRTLRDNFDIAPTAEITVESAPGQLAPATLDAFLAAGVNRLSFGVQSFIDRESAAIGRLHTAAQCLAEIARVHAAGIPSVSLDLIAGLPHQTEASWRESLAQAIATAVAHVSIYLLEIDEDSRLGRELLASGDRYSAAQVPSDDQAADLYQLACDTLTAAGIVQYEISNFARPGHASRHNLKYWHRAPYLGFGLDAHSMLLAADGSTLRFANPDDLDHYALEIVHRRQGIASPESTPQPDVLSILDNGAHPFEVDRLTDQAVLEETLFLSLRLNAGLDLNNLALHTASTLATLHSIFEQAITEGLLTQTGSRIRLTSRGRLLSNELFSRLLFAA